MSDNIRVGIFHVGTTLNHPSIQKTNWQKVQLHDNILSK